MNYMTPYEQDFFIRKTIEQYNNNNNTNIDIETLYQILYNQNNNQDKKIINAKNENDFYVNLLHYIYQNHLIIIHKNNENFNKSHLTLSIVI